MTIAERLRAIAAEVALLEAQTPVDPPIDQPDPTEPPPEPEPSPAPSPAPEPAPPNSDAPRVLRILNLGRGEDGPYLSSVKPVFRSETGSYNRQDSYADFSESALPEWSWALEAGVSTTARARMLIDGEPVTDWLAPDIGSRPPYSGSGSFWRFENLTLPRGMHVAHVELEGDAAFRCCGVDFSLNDTARRLPDEMQTPWTSTMRFEMEYTHASPRAVQVDLSKGPAQFPRKPLKPRTIEPLTDIETDKSKLWVRAITDNIGLQITRYPAVSMLGDYSIVRAQKYFHEEAISAPNDTAMPAPRVPEIDGPRGKLGHVVDMRVRSGDMGIYFYTSHMRLGLLSYSGDVLTEFGPYLPNGYGAHPGIFEAGYQGAADPVAFAAKKKFYADQFAHVGDESQLSESSKTSFEGWGFEMMRRGDQPGTFNLDDAHEFWMTRTRGGAGGFGAIVFGDHWTAHSAAGFQPAHFPPRGYVQAPARTGTSTYCDFVTDHPSCRNPWSIRFRVQDQKFYWSNIGGHSFGRCNIDGSEPEIFVISATTPTDAEFGVTNGWLRASTRSALDLRTQYLRDGAFGVASLHYPMSMSFDSEGNLVFAELYTYAIRKIDFAARTITTLTTLYDATISNSASGQHEPTLYVDHKGHFGPVDDIFVMSWSNGPDRRFSKTGERRYRKGTDANPFYGFTFMESGDQVMPCGPQNLALPPNYGWGIAGDGGRLIGAGNAGGWQFCEVTRRLPTDEAPDVARWKSGRAAWRAAGVPELVLGPHAQGGLCGAGDLLGSLPDDEAKAQLVALGVAPTAADDTLYYVRFNHTDRQL